MDTGYNGHYMNVAKGAKEATLKYLHIGEVSTPTSDDPHWPKTHNPYFLHPDEANLPQKDTTEPVPMVTLRPDEAKWHQDKLKNFKGRSVLLSHHQLYAALDVCGLPQKKLADGTPDPADFNRIWLNTGLYEQVGPWFKDKVAAWIWGHEHNLLIFGDNYRPADWPVPAADSPYAKTLPIGRCAGHSAIPVQDTEQPYKVNYPVPLKRSDLKLGLTTVGKDNWYNHGFQLLQLAGAGNPGLLSYFQVELDNNTPMPLYMEQIF
jgi:hypothetical protein